MNFEEFISLNKDNKLKSIVLRNVQYKYILYFAAKNILLFF